MSIIGNSGKGREAYLSEVLVFEARRAFGEALHRFQNERYLAQTQQTLRPLFLRTGGQRYEFDQYMVFEGWLRWGGRGGPGDAKAIDKYLAALERFVVEQLRCTSAGEPTKWVLHTVHADVARTAQVYGSLLETFPMRDESVAVSLEINLAADGSLSMHLMDANRGVRIRLEDGEGGFDGFTHTDFGRRFDAWKDLKASANELLDLAIEHLKTNHRHQTRDFEDKNASSLALLDQDADALVAWHWAGKDPESSRQRSRSVRLRKLLGIDPPPRREAKKQPPKLGSLFSRVAAIPP